jgi:(p)ppGpp synthase/HD superfamily hydrolase
MDNLPIQSLQDGFSARSRKRVFDASQFAETYLSSVFRRSGQNYARHGFEVARTVREADVSAETVVIALLHDILMHPQGEELLKKAPLTDHERSLVVRMHALRRLHIDENTRDLDRVIEAFTEESDILLLRMAHRLNDVRSLALFSPVLRTSIARETLHMYSAIAGRLGLHLWRNEMEDICFLELEPNMAGKLQAEFDAMKKIDHISLSQTMKFLEASLREKGIEPELSFRMKGLYSTYRKMLIKNRRFEELTDRLAIRIVVSDIDTCYRTLGLVHAHMHPIPGKLKDYIGAPKQNGYRSIHTVVYPLPGVTEQPIEIQIRTPAMHRECELGIAAHHTYKDMQYALTTNQARMDLFRSLSLLREEVRSPEQFETALRSYYGEHHLVLFDTDNNLYQLSKPATALDFVAHAFGKRSALLKHVRINGRLRPLRTPLHDGDTVEPLFSRYRQLSPEWLKQCQLKGTRALLRSLQKKPQKAIVKG